MSVHGTNTDAAAASGTSATQTKWVTATVLQLLAQAGPQVGDEFTAGQLQVWATGRLTPEQRVHATSRLCQLGFLRHRQTRGTLPGEIGVQIDHYRLTAEGFEAVQAAAAGHVRKSGPKGTRRPNGYVSTSLVMRLWSLLRMRRVIDSDAAASTLCNAGDDVERMRASVRKYLRRWADAGALAESKKRIGAAGHSNGSKRYVLMVDTVEPPRWRAKAKATAGETQA